MTKRTTQPPQRKKKKGHCALTPLDLLNDPRFVGLRIKHGFASVGWYTVLTLLLHRLPDHRINRSELHSAAFLVGGVDADELRRILDSLVDAKVFSETEEYYYSQEVIDDCVSLDIKRDKWRTSKREARGQSKDNSKLSEQEQELETEQEKELEEEGCKGEGDLKIHPSPAAPKNLTRYDEELKPQDPANIVWLTDAQVEVLTYKWGEDQLKYWIERLADFSTTNPKLFKNYKEHGRVLRSWRKKAIEQGKVFHTSITHEPGMYFPRDIE